VWCFLALAIACGAAAYQGVVATRDVAFPADEDLARDVAAAETIASGHPLSDPVYRGEWLWYNPLTPAIVAAIATVARRPVPFVYSRLGAYFNLLIPLSLFAVVLSWWGFMQALVAVLALLYLIPGAGPGWLTASYSPWLYPMHVGQAMFYVALLAITHAWRNGGTRAFAWAGLALGTTLLTHTAPALLLAAAMGMEVLRTECRQGTGGSQRIVRYVVFAAAFLAAAAPLLASIVGHYHLQIKNAGPGVYVLYELGLERAWALWRPVLTPSIVTLVTAAGYVQLIRRREDLAARLLLSIAGTAGLFLLYGYLAQTSWAASHHIVTIVPTHHFWYYLTAVTAMVFAHGVAAIADAIGGLQARAGGWMARASPYTMRILTALVVVAAIVRYPAYTRRYDFRAAAAAARQMFTDPVLRDMYDWLRQSTARDDVFAAPTNLAQSVIGMSGRKVVVVGKFFSNPYVDWGTRAEDNLAMDRYLRAADFGGFLRVASKYRVRYVARTGRVPDALLKEPLFSEAWSGGSWVIYRVGR
jgi:hypothetical protein